MFIIRNWVFRVGIFLTISVAKYTCAPTPQKFGGGGDTDNPAEGSGDYDALISNNDQLGIMPTCLSNRTESYTFFSTKTTYLHPEIGNQNTDIIQLPRKLVQCCRVFDLGHESFTNIYSHSEIYQDINIVSLGLFQTSSAPKVNVNCGNHSTETCGDCTLGRGKYGCLKGDCHWEDKTSTCVENSN